MKKLLRWLGPSLALLGTTVSVAIAVVPTAAGDDPAGRFVLGNESALIDAEVTLWGAQWWKENDLSTDSTRPPFKGYALDVDEANCTFSTRTGNSTPPPDPPLGAVIKTIITDQVHQDGSVIYGTIVGFAWVRTTGSYDDNPGHEATGTVIDIDLDTCRPHDDGGDDGGGF
jgi:hypothetical protein